jgi:putative ABC transport system permease protein
MAEVKSAYAQLFPGSPYEYFFLDEFFDRQYKAELSFNHLFGLFSTLGIVVACLGLFGLSAYMAARRTKEIGIRKAMGASVGSTVLLLTRDFLKLIVVAAIIAIPLEWYIIGQWLAGYASRIDITWWMLLAPLFLTLLLALVTVSFQTLKTALINPSKCLQYE